MEQHPIPQDVTGFQFRLIGDMTIKQFAYVAAGVILAYLCFNLPLSPLIKIPLALLIGGFGAALAFVPIEGRPLDVMVTHFVKALFTPTQYTYQKVGGKLSMTSVHMVTPQKTMVAVHTAPEWKQQRSDDSRKKLQMYLQQLPHATQNKLDQKEQVFFESMAHGFTQLPSVPQPAMPQQPSEGKQQGSGTYFVSVTGDQPQEQPQPQAQPPVPAPVPTPPQQADDTKNEQALIAQEQAIQQALAEAKKQEELQVEAHQETAQTHEKVNELEGQLNEVMVQKQKLEEQLLRLQKKLDTTHPQVFTPSTATVQPQEQPAQTQNVRRIPRGMETKVGTPMTPDVPNIILGIIKDPRGNVLPGILVEVKDAEGNPVRAFKTNQLGQFASATPLLNGTYTIEFEDSTEKNTFATIQLEAIGAIMEPIEVISNDKREDLRKSLFGKPGEKV